MEKRTIILTVEQINHFAEGQFKDDMLDIIENGGTVELSLEVPAEYAEVRASRHAKAKAVCHWWEIFWCN